MNERKRRQQQLKAVVVLSLWSENGAEGRRIALLRSSFPRRPRRRRWVGEKARGVEE
jgi:hypothetical protein